MNGNLGSDIVVSAEQYAKASLSTNVTFGNDADTRAVQDLKALDIIRDTDWHATVTREEHCINAHDPIKFMSLSMYSVIVLSTKSRNTASSVDCSTLFIGIHRFLQFFFSPITSIL